MGVAFVMAMMMSGVAAGWKDCSDSGAISSDLELSLWPEAPGSGEKQDLSVAFILERPVAGGLMDLQITFSGFPVVNDKLDLCEELGKNGISCPIEAGAHNFTWENTVPDGLPHGRLDTRETWWDGDTGEQILCFDYVVDI